MLHKQDNDIESLLIRFNEGDLQARERLLELTYTKLKRLARQLTKRENDENFIDADDLVHEAVLRVFDQTRPSFQDRNHFFAIMTMLMRRILLDNARRHYANKRGGTYEQLSLDEVTPYLTVKSEIESLIALDQTLNDLEAFDPRQARIVELRVFAGLSIEEVAEVLHISPATVKREWTSAKAWLYHRLSPKPENN